MKSLLEKISSKLNKISFIEEEVDRQSKLIDKKKIEEVELVQAIELNSSAQVVLIKLFERLNAKGLTALDRLIEGALSRVYPDMNYEVNHEIKMERGANQLRWFLKEFKPDGQLIISNMKDSVGGGVRMIGGLIGLAFYLMKTGAERLIFADEAFSQIDDSRVENLFEFLRSLGKTGGFINILITHDSRFKPYLDKEYIMQRDGYLKRKR